jgi:hypothetical protein
MCCVILQNELFFPTFAVRPATSSSDPDDHQRPDDSGMPAALEDDTDQSDADDHGIDLFTYAGGRIDVAPIGKREDIRGQRLMVPSVVSSLYTLHKLHI